MFGNLDFYRDDNLFFKLYVFVIVGSDADNFFHHHWHLYFSSFNNNSWRLFDILNCWLFDYFLIMDHNFSNNFFWDLDSCVDSLGNFYFFDNFLDDWDFNSPLDLYGNFL